MVTGGGRAGHGRGQALAAGVFGRFSERWLWLKGRQQTSFPGPPTLGDSLTVEAGPAGWRCGPAEMVGEEQV